MDYGKAIRVIRAIRNLQQKQLADGAGLNASYLCLIEQGKRVPSLDAIEKIARAADIPPQMLNLLAAEEEDVRNVSAGELALVSQLLARILFSTPAS